MAAVDVVKTWDWWVCSFLLSLFFSFFFFISQNLINTLFHLLLYFYSLNLHKTLCRLFSKISTKPTNNNGPPLLLKLGLGHSKSSNPKFHYLSPETKLTLCFLTCFAFSHFPKPKNLSNQPLSLLQHWKERNVAVNSESRDCYKLKTKTKTPFMDSPILTNPNRTSSSVLLFLSSKLLGEECQVHHCHQGQEGKVQ